MNSRISQRAAALSPSLAPAIDAKAKQMFTVIFAIGRMPGWIANFKEIMDEPKTRIYGPRRICMGPTLNRYMPMKERA